MPASLAITRDDYEALPEGPPWFQLIEGELIQSPSPTTRHQRIVLRLSARLHEFVEARRLGEVFLAPLDVFLNALNIYQPDIVFISRSRQEIITEKGIEGTPNLCVEVLSKRTERFDKSTKLKVFAQAGVQEIWLIDPATETASICEFNRGECSEPRILNNGDILKSSQIPDLAIPLGELFSTR